MSFESITCTFGLLTTLNSTAAKAHAAIVIFGDSQSCDKYFK